MFFYLRALRSLSLLSLLSFQDRRSCLEQLYVAIPGAKAHICSQRLKSGVIDSEPILAFLLHFNDFSMKFLHTADWHLGKLLKTVSRLHDQRFVLEQILDHIDREKPDVMLLAGDIYDRSVPAAEAVELFDDIMHRIVIDLKTPVIAIAGNHDSAERIDCYSGLLARQGLYIRGVLHFPIQPITLGDCEFFAIPFATPEFVRSLIQDEAQKAAIITHDDAMQAIISEIERVRNPAKKAVFIAHCFASGANNDGDEERSISVGGVETVVVHHFAPFAYTALGHLHRPQSFANGRVRYAGSPVPYSFSEIGYEKTISLIDLHEDGSLEHRAIPLPQKRNVMIVRGSIQMQNGEKRFVLDEKEDKKKERSEKEIQTPQEQDFLRVELTNETLVLEPMQTIQREFPNALELDFIHLSSSQSRSEHRTTSHLTAEEIASFSPLQLFENFYRSMTQTEVSSDSGAFLTKIFRQAEERITTPHETKPLQTQKETNE
jgi:DNA repair protein SbcD/Mre11